MADVVRQWSEAGGRLVRARLSAPPKNVIDAAVVDGLAAVLHSLPRGAMTLLIDAEGEHFSYGSSVEEHRPGRIREVLPRFHALCRALVDCPVPVVFAVRGYCLGGGLELALCGDVTFAAERAMFGLPEPSLGCFAPVGSLLLRERIGEGRARELLLSGRLVTALDARTFGLIHETADDPSEAAVRWCDQHVLTQSPTTIRLGVRAARLQFRRAFHDALADVERLYLDELAQTPDCAEGVEAFLEKRKPKWADA